MTSTSKETQKKQSFQILSGSTLKIIAIILMVIDHIGAVVLYHGYLLPNAPIAPDSDVYKVYLFYNVLRFIGRSAFPIFCFLLVQGFIHTSNKGRFAIRLLIFAIISEVPFDIAIFDSWWDIAHQNIFFTLLIGFLVMWVWDIYKKKKDCSPDSSSEANMYLRDLPFQLLILGLGMFLAHFLKTDYGYWGVLLIGVLYFFRSNSSLQALGGSLCLLWEAPAILAFIPINMYNHQRGASLKYFFYLFYPAHLLILALIRYFVFRG